ncbi:hypothetical protein D3C77_394830 [compost metagenome]
MLLVLASDIAETQGVGIELEVAVVSGDQGSIKLGVILGTDIDLVLAGDARLILDPVGLAGGLAITDRTTDTGPRAEGCGDADVELLALDLTAIGHRRHVQVAADSAGHLIATQVGTGDGGVFAAGEVQTVAGIQVGVLLTLGVTVQIALAHADADVDAHAFRTDGETDFASTVMAIAVAAAVVLRRTNVQVVSGSKVDVATGLDLGSGHVQVITGIELDVAPCLQLGRRRRALGAILEGFTIAATDAGLEAAAGTAVQPRPDHALAAFLADAALGHIQVDIAALDDNVATGLQLPALDRDIIASLEVEVIAGIERRSAIRLFDLLLVAALDAVAHLAVARRPGQKLSDRIDRAQGARPFADAVLTLRRDW